MSIQEIIQGCVQRSNEHQKALFELYGAKMLVVCMRYSRHRMEAEDMLQDGFIQVYRKIDQYRFQGPVEQWIRRIMINTALKTVRKHSFIKEKIGLDQSNEQQEDPVAIQQMSEEEILKAIMELPDGYRTVFNLYAIEGMNHKEISERLNIKESTSRSQLLKARRILQKKIRLLYNMVV